MFLYNNLQMLYNTHTLSLSVRIHSNFVVSNDDSYIFYFCIKINIAGKIQSSG